MSKNSELQKRREAAIPRGVGNNYAIYAERARNAELWDVEGRRYIDFASGIAVLNTGHVHPALKSALAAQIERFTHACFQVTPYESYVALAERLNALAPGKTPKKTIFLSTGAEAVENAIKIARYHTKRSGVIAFSGGFHGRTLACSALTGKVVPYKAGFGPMLPEVYHLPYPIAYHGISTDDSLAALEQLFKADVDPSRVAAIIIEPVLGEGGFYAAPVELLRHLRTLCDKHGIVLILDEIQTGFARTGRLFATEYAGIEPDLMTVAKGITSGTVPMGAVIAKQAIHDVFMNGPEHLIEFFHGYTYSAHPLACAAGIATLDTYAEEGLLTRASELQGYFAEQVHSLREEPNVIDIRNIGLVAGIELQPNAEGPTKRAYGIFTDLYERGLLVRTTGDIVALSPPLIVEREQIDQIVDMLRAALRRAA